jgi:hypothetical protein
MVNFFLRALLEKQSYALFMAPCADDASGFGRQASIPLTTFASLLKQSASSLISLSSSYQPQHETLLQVDGWVVSYDFIHHLTQQDSYAALFEETKNDYVSTLTVSNLECPSLYVDRTFCRAGRLQS